MNRIIVRALSLLAIFILAACSQNAMRGAFVPQSAPSLAQSTGDGDVPFVGPNPVRRLCPAAGSTDQMQCFGLVRNDVTLMPQLSPEIGNAAEKCPFKMQAYCPIDLQTAYKLPSLTKGAGNVVAIVDAYGYKHAASDLAVFRTTMGLKPCLTATKCLRILNQNGRPSPLPKEPPPSSAGWIGEESLDLDMVSGICPNCKIVLIQADNNLTNNLYTSVKTAGRLAKYISNSWGGPESGGDNSTFHQHGVVITAAAGDNGGGGTYGGAAQPCSYTYVVCVGGTHLVRSGNSRGWSETVWNDFADNQCSGSCGATGSGCSKFIAKPVWQNDTGCKMRSESDVSATASVRAPVAVYNSELGCAPPNCWFAFGGTSVSTPLIASAYALAGNAGIQAGAASIWKHHAGNLFDVLQGNNIDPKLGIHCASRVTYICTARIGFDGPTGWGTPKGIGAF